MKLNLRMYFFVPYNLSPIQQSIQAGHAALEYALVYGATELFKDFAVNHKTWIILNGGTTNSSETNSGSLQEIIYAIKSFNEEYAYGPSNISELLDFSFFNEPDINDALTAICFIVDERVFNTKDYPNWKQYLWNLMGNDFSNSINKSDDELKEEHPTVYKEWLELIGGHKNEFLKNLLKDKRLA